MLRIGTWVDDNGTVHGKVLSSRVHKKLVYPACNDGSKIPEVVPPVEGAPTVVVKEVSDKPYQSRGIRLAAPIPRELFLTQYPARSLTCDRCIEILEPVMEAYNRASEESLDR